MNPTDTPNTDQAARYVPLVRHGSQFLMAPAAEDLWDEMVRTDVLEQYIHRTCSVIRANVVIKGNFYEANVYVPNSGDDEFCYVPTSEDLVPVGCTNIQKGNESSFSLGEALPDERLCWSESVDPSTQTDLVAQFIRPEFDYIGPPGLVSKTVSWDRVGSFSHLVLLGEAGSGKTTCLRRLGVETFLGERQQYAKFPVYVQMRGLAEKSLDIESILRSVAEDRGAAYLDPQWVNGAVLLLDGLDEIPTEAKRNECIRAIRHFVAEFPRVRIVVSTRLSSYKWELPEFLHLKLRSFGNAQIAEWSGQAIARSEQSEEWVDFIGRLRESVDLLELAANPLVLSVIVSLFRNYALLPSDRTQVMSHVVRALVEGWDYARGVSRRVKGTWWSNPDRKMRALCRISYHSVRENRDWWTSEDCSGWAIGVLPRKAEEGATTTTNQALQILWEDTDLLRCEGPRWTFRSGAVREFLAAQYCVESTQAIDSLIHYEKHSTPWRKVWAHACGLTYDATDLLRQLLKRRDLDDVGRAIWALEAVGQQFDADDGLVDECCLLITNAIVHSSRGLESARIPAEDPTGKHSGMWLITVENVSKTDQSSDHMIKQLRKMLLAIHRGRTSFAGAMIIESMGRANSAVVKELAVCMRGGGVYSDRVESSANSRRLIIELRHALTGEGVPTRV